MTGDVFLVDDNPGNLRRLAEILKAAGVATRAATSAGRALAAVRTQPPDLVLLDIELPDGSGFDLCTELLAEPATKDLRVVFMSAHDGPLERARGFRVGGVDYLVKPYDEAEVLAKVATQLELVRLRRENAALRGPRAEP